MFLTLNEWGNEKVKIDVNRQNIGEKANLHLWEFESDIISCSLLVLTGSIDKPVESYCRFQPCQYLKSYKIQVQLFFFQAIEEKILS